MACAEATTYSERVHRVGRPSNAYILIWNFRDPLTPEYVLQAPYEVFAFQFNPMNPDIVTAGCYNGQVVMWNLAGEQVGYDYDLSFIMIPSLCTQHSLYLIPHMS